MLRHWERTFRWRFTTDHRYKRKLELVSREDLVIAVIEIDYASKTGPRVLVGPSFDRHEVLQGDRQFQDRLLDAYWSEVQDRPTWVRTRRAMVTQEVELWALSWLRWEDARFHLEAIAMGGSL